MDREDAANQELNLAERLLAIGKDCAQHLSEPFKSVEHGTLLYGEDVLCVHPSSMLTRSFAIILEPDPAGGYTAIAPALPGVVTEGNTLDETLENTRDAIRLCLEDLAEHGAEIPESDIDTD